MSNATYTLELELAYNTWTDVSADWRTPVPLVIERGIAPGEQVAGVGRMTFALHNPDGRYTPGHASARAGFAAGIGARLRASDGASTHTLFYGRITEIAPAQGAERARHAVPLPMVRVSVVDDIAALERARAGAFPLLFDVTPGDLAERLISRSFVPVGRFGYWRMQHPQAGQIGSGTRVAERATGVSVDEGQSVFPWAGDTWPADLSALDALRDVCASEGGFFWIAADGTPTFTDRHARVTHTTPDAALDTALAGLSAARSEARVANRVEVTAYPRAVGEAEAVLWQAGHAVRIGHGEVRTLVCRYSDPDERVAQVGAQSVVTPVMGVDFSATRHADGSGEDLTDTIRLRVEAGGSAARLALWSTDTRKKPVYVQGLQLRGVPLRSAFPSTVVAEDDDSRLTHGLRLLRVDMPLQDDTGVAGDVALALLGHHRDAQPWLTLTVEAGASSALLAQALARDVGDRLHVSDAALALDGAACFIDGLRHEIGASHRVTWHTSPAGLHACWLIGQSKVGSETRVGY